MALATWRERTRLAAEPTTRVYRGLAWIAERALQLWSTAEYRGEDKVPRDGGVLVVSNHISNADPLELGQFLISRCDRWGYFIGKSDIWKVPGLGWLAARCGQIPVERNSEHAKDVVAVAAAEIERGKVVCIYPEGTITGDPDQWPMAPRTGAARIALASGCPVIPVAQWGANQILPGKKLTYPRLWPLFPKAHFTVVAGDPIVLDDLRAQDLSREVIVEASNRIMDAITALVEQIRDERAPDTRLDLRSGQRVPRTVVATTAPQV